MFLQLFIITVVLLALAMLGFAIQIIIKPKGKFSSTSVGGSKAMRERKIYCVRTEQKLIDKKLRKKGEKNKCASCSCR